MLQFFEGLFALLLALSRDSVVVSLQLHQVLLYGVGDTQDDNQGWLELFARLRVVLTLLLDAVGALDREVVLLKQ